MHHDNKEYSVARRSLDGGVIRITSREETSSGYTGFATASLDMLGLTGQYLGHGNLGFAEKVASDPLTSMDFRFDEEYSFQGGQLRIGHGHQPVEDDNVKHWELGRDGVPRLKLVHIAIWQGKSSSFYTDLFGGEADLFIPILDQFNITETTEGVALIPRSPTTNYVRPPRILQDIPSVGLLEIERLTSGSSNSVPSHPGTTVAGGELYVQGLGLETMYLLLVSESALTYISPHSGVAESSLVEAASTLRVGWEG